MTKFVAIKIHYDHRKSLPPYLKYSKAPTSEEYREYLDLFHKEGIGGEGFHECLNISIHGGDSAKIYLPPTCLPNDKFADEEMVFFSFTYKYDKELPSNIIGVHAAARYLALGRRAIERSDIQPIKGAERFHYHAEAPSEYTTLLSPSVEYDYRDGKYSPIFKSWGYGLRYISEVHARNIVLKALQGARHRVSEATGAELEVVRREITVLEAIEGRYFGSAKGKDASPKGVKFGSTGGGIPDRELGYLGEKYIYDKEVAYALKNGFPASAVEWVSQVVPQSPFDIKSIRIVEGRARAHFIEVKSTQVAGDTNIYVSSRQVEFFSENEGCAVFNIVHFASREKVSHCREMSFGSLLQEFELVPIKYKLRALEAAET